MFHLLLLFWKCDWLLFEGTQYRLFIFLGGGRGVGKVDCKAVSFFLKIGLVKGKINSLTQGKCASITCP